MEWAPPAEQPDAEYPFVLSTGRRLYHYHTRTQTGRCGGLNDLLGAETADISVRDAHDLGIAQGEKIRVISRRGSVEVAARITPPGARRPGVDGVPFQGGVCQLADQPRIRSGFQNR